MGPQPPISVSEHSDMPIYRQIVTQLTFMIEMGQLGAGDRLPGSRCLLYTSPSPRDVEESRMPSSA